VPVKGHVPTPKNLAEDVVQGLLEPNPPSSGDRILYPGIGTAPFAVATKRLCERNDWSLPEGVGVELDPAHVTTAREQGLSHVSIEERDFLDSEMRSADAFDYVVGNPPYIPIEKIDNENKPRFREQFDTATGRFDLYLLFFEQALRLLAPGGRLSFVTPEKYQYVDAAAPLREQLTSEGTQVERIDHIDEHSFDSDITFPCVTVVQKAPTTSETDDATLVSLRDGSSHTAELPDTGESWAADIRGGIGFELDTTVTLGDVTERISPGMATGADAVFVSSRDEVPPQLVPDWVYPTVSGRELSENDGPECDSVLICPYGRDGSLPGEDQLGAFRDWAEFHREELEDRTCVKKDGDSWYAWHENPPMDDLLQQKIVFKDIAKEPRFWLDEGGNVIPRHSVYYMIPTDSELFDPLLEYLNSPTARNWMQANCQRAANGFLRLQTRVLEDLPVPREWADSYQTTL
jgi:SAM-dependent methyltransferase